MADITPAVLQEAAVLLGIRERASLNEIRQKYHELVKASHPDVSDRDPMVSHEVMIRLKAAYDLLVDYCTNYVFRSESRTLNRTLKSLPRTSGWSVSEKIPYGIGHSSLFESRKGN